MNPFHYLALIKTSVKRYIQIDLNYKFQIATDVVDLVLTILAFAVLGSFVDDAASPEELGINYNLQGFLFIGVFFWAFFQRSYEDTVDTIPEEASRGTVGFLITNNVNLSTLLISRNVASMVKTSIMSLVVVLPVLLVIDYAQVQSSQGYQLTDSLILQGQPGSSVVVQDQTLYFELADGMDRTLGDNGSLSLVDPGSNTLLKLFAAINANPNWQCELAEEAQSSDNATLLVPGDYPVGAVGVTLEYRFSTAYQSVFAGFSLRELPVILAIFFLAWVFMLSVSVLIASLNIISKRVRPFAIMMITLLKVISGYWFPIEAMQDYGHLYEILRHIPIVTCLIFLRDMVLTPDLDLTPNQIWGLYLEPILVGTLVVVVSTLIVYKYLERKSQKWGTLEFY